MTRKQPRKVKSLDAFLGLPAKPMTETASTKHKKHVKEPRGARKPEGTGNTQQQATAQARKGDFIEAILEEFFYGDKPKKEERKERVRKEEKPKEVHGKERGVKEEKTREKPKAQGVFAVDAKPPVGEEPEQHIGRKPLNEIVPTGEILRKLLAKTAEELKRIECDAEGACNDGHRISDVFIDEHGFRRQRGFVRTTRIPVFLDWIVEEATVYRLLERAYVVETERGAMAIVPVDFLCELDKRYGVLLKNYDCSKHTTNPYAASSHKK